MFTMEAVAHAQPRGSDFGYDTCHTFTKTKASGKNGETADGMFI
jgi:hypothetical protein